MKSVNIQTLMQTSGVVFGTSGARGLVESMTDEVCAGYVNAFLIVMRQSFQFKRVALGMDLRPSSPTIATACAEAIRLGGLQVDFCGALPTPALALYAQQEAIPAIMVTGSHIPFDRNGIKFYRPDGEISKADEQAMTALQVELLVDLTPERLPAINTQALIAYQRRYLDFFPADMLAGFRLGLYEHSSVARDCLRYILEQLGAHVTSLDRTEHFVPIDTEAVSTEDSRRGLSWSKQHAFDAIISTDGDGDRPLISDEQGHWLRGDIVGLLCARYLGIKGLAVPVSCNTAIELSGFFESVIRTRIGSPYVIEGMSHLAEKMSGIAGFEANGGFLAGSGIVCGGKMLATLPTRDAVLPILAILAAAKEQKIPISGLLMDLPKRYTASDRLQNIPTAISQQLLNTWCQNCSQLCELLGTLTDKPVLVNDVDGLRITFGNGEIIHLRGSGNAPELRCYCETDNPERAKALTQIVLKRISELTRHCTYELNLRLTVTSIGKRLK
jgi:phosphomannomutase